MTSPPCECKLKYVDHALSGMAGDPEIQYCPLHASAHQMLQALQGLVIYAEDYSTGNDHGHYIENAKDAIAAAQGIKE